MDYFLQGFGVFLGVLAGTAVTILVGLWFQRRSETQQTGNLKFELGLNVRKIDSWLEEITRYRNAVNGDSLHMYFGHFDLSRFVSVTANAMFQSGQLYKVLSQDEIGQLQVIVSEFSAYGEQYMNNQITQARQSLDQSRVQDSGVSWAKEGKPQAVANVDFWENKFRDHKKTLQQIISTLK